MRLLSVLVLVALGLPATAFAGETVTYSYDAKGRLTNVAHSGGRTDGQASAYTLDAADNRTNVTVTGAPFDTASGRVIVLPLKGMPLLILPTAP